MSDVYLNNLPNVSVIVPVYNGADTLDMCLKSLLEIDYPKDKFEIIVIDNGSTDLSVNVAEKYPVCILHETDIKSSYAARNKGILASKGELIAFTDADCIVTPQWLKYLVTEWEDASIGCFAGEIVSYKPETLVEKFTDRQGILRQAGTLNSTYLAYTQTANSAYRREIFDKVGLFIPELISGGDADISWRMQRQLGLKIKFIPEALVYHKHRTSITGLYNQFRKYEQGKIIWCGYYPDYPVPTKSQRRNEFLQSLREARDRSFENIKKYILRENDFVDVATPFLNAVINYGTYRAHE